MIDNPSLRYMTPPSSSREKNPALNTVGGVAWKDLNAGKYTVDDNWKMLGFDLNRNNDYAYDDAQSTGQWWSNAIHRAINPITTSYLESFRIDKTLGELFSSSYSASTDASLKDYLKKTEDLNYLYANYDNPDIGEGFKGYFSSGARNKWSSMIESSGFMIGTALGGITQSLMLGAITAPEGGVGAAVGLAKTLENVYNIGKVGQLANDYNKLNKINKLWAQTKAFTKITSPGLQAIEGVSQFNAAATGFGRLKAVGKIIGNGAIRIQAASSEAMLEAIDGSDRFYKQQVAEEEKDLGRELTKEEKDKIQDYSADLFHARWAANVGILAVNNVLQDYNLFNTFKKLSKAGDVGILAGRAAEKTVFSKSLGKWSTVSALPYKEWVLHKAKTIGGFAAKNILSEGYEEWAQYAIDKSTDDYFTRKYNKQSVSFMDSVSKGISSALNDKEGKENFWAGAIMGGVFSGAGAVATNIHGKVTGKTAEVNNMAAGNAERLNKEQESLNNLMKTELVMSPESESANLNHSKNDDMHNAKDKKEVEDIRRQTIVNAVKTAKEVGKYDVFIDKLRSQGEMSDEDFIKEFKIEDTKLKPSQEYVNTILQEAEQIKKDLDIIDEMYVNPHLGYQNINPIKNADSRREQFTKYKGFEEAKTILLENLSSLRASHKNITENNAWFSTKGIVADDFIAYTQKDGGTKRTEKIKELNDRIADNEELLGQALLSAKDRKVYSNMNKELRKELKIYEDLNNDSEDSKNRIAFFNYLKKEVPQVENTSTRAFSKTLAEKLDEAIKEVDKNQTSLKAVDLLEDPMEFEKLYNKYAEEYDKRYEQVQSDINENKEEDKKEQAKKEKEEATEEPFKEPEVVVEPIPTEDLNNATEDLPASKETIERVATELADKKSLSDDSKKIYSVEKNKIAIDKRKTEIELKRKEDEEKAKDPNAFTIKKKVEKLNEQKQKEVTPLKEKVAKLKKERDVLEKEPVGSVEEIEAKRQYDLSHIATDPVREPSEYKAYVLKINEIYDAEIEALKNTTTGTQSKKADIEKRKQADLDKIPEELGNVFKPEPGSIEAKLVRIGIFIQDVLKWNITGLNSSKANDRLELVIDGKIVNLPKGANIKTSNNQFYAAFTPQDLVEAKYKVELAELGIKEEEVDNTKLDGINNEIVELEAEVKKVEDRYNKEIALEQEKLVIKNEEEEKENNTEVPLVGEENTKSAVELSDDAIKAIAKTIYEFSDTEFLGGQVFRSSTGAEVRDGEVQKMSEMRDKISLVKNAIYNRTRKNKKTLAELNIYVTLKKDNDDYYHDDNFYKDNKDDMYKHPVLAVLTDEKGNDLYFTNTGMITKDSTKGIKITEQLYDVTSLDMANRIKNRTEAREKATLLGSFLQLTKDESSKLYKELEAEVKREFEQLAEIKDYIRKTNKTITIINTSVSSGFEEKQEYEVVKVKDIKGIKNMEIQIQVAHNLESVEGMTKNTQTSGFVFIQSMYEKDVLILPKLKTEFGETIEYLQNDIISKSADTVLTEEEKTELNNRKKFLNAIFYRTVGSKDKATADDHKGTDAPRKSKTTGINKIMLDGKNKQFSIVMHENNRTFDHLRVNVDKTLLETDEKIMTYKVVGGKLVKKEMLYSDFIKSLATIVRPTKDIKNPNRRYNTVFGLDPKEAFSKYQKENPVVSVPKIKVAKGAPKTDIQEESQEDLTNVFGKPLTEDEKTENAVSLLDVNGFRDRFSAVGIDFKEGYKKVVFNNVESESEGTTSLRLDGLPFLDRANALPKIPVKIQTKDGRVLDRTYFVDKLIDRIEKSLLVEQTEPTKAAENEELVKDVDEEGKVVKKPEIKMGRVKKDYFNRVLVKSSILKRGITEMDIIDDLVKNNIVEKICKN